jgi:hypothetical protein
MRQKRTIIYVYNENVKMCFKQTYVIYYAKKNKNEEKLENNVPAFLFADLPSYSSWITKNACGRFEPFKSASLYWCQTRKRGHYTSRILTRGD